MKKQSGFTLIELMIVVVIIGTLAAIALPNFLHMVTRAKESSVKENMHTFQLAVEEFATLNRGLYPSDDNDPTSDTGETLQQLLPALKWPVNPFTGNFTNIDFIINNATPHIPNDPDLPKGEFEYDSDGDGNPNAEMYAIHGGDGEDGNGMNLSLVLKNF